MNLLDIVFLLVYGFACYIAGRVTMMNNIVKAVTEEVEAEQGELEVMDSNINDLFVEKIDDVYYAYVGTQFVGQNNNIEDLFQNMKKIYKVETFRVKNIDGLSKEDHRKIAEAIANNYNLK